MITSSVLVVLIAEYIDGLSRIVTNEFLKSIIKLPKKKEEEEEEKNPIQLT